MPDETAVLDLPAPAVEDAAPPPEMPETEQPEAPETPGGEADAPESEVEADPLAALDDDALSSNERIKALLEKERQDVLARERESARRSAEHQANLRAKQERETNRRMAADGSVSNELLTAIRNATGDEEFKWDDRHTGPALKKALNQYGDFFRETTNEAVESGAAQYIERELGTAIPPEHVSYLAQVKATGDPAHIAFGYSAVIAANAYQKGLAEGRAAAEAELAAQNKTETKRGADAAKREAPKPSRAGGGAPPPAKNWREQYESPGSTFAQRKEAFEHLYPGKRFED